MMLGVNGHVSGFPNPDLWAAKPRGENQSFHRLGGAICSVSWWSISKTVSIPTKTQLSNFLGIPGEDYFKGNPKSLNFYFLVIWWGKHSNRKWTFWADSYFLRNNGGFSIGYVSLPEGHRFTSHDASMGRWHIYLHFFLVIFMVFL